MDNILNILASSMLAVTTFSLSTMVTAFGSATTHVTPRAMKLVVEDSTTQNVLATFIGSFLFSLVGIIALNMGAYGEQGRSDPVCGHAGGHCINSGDASALDSPHLAWQRR
ncbi:DUF2254 family protein [Pantoea ananatis]